MSEFYRVSFLKMPFKKEKHFENFSVNIPCLEMALLTKLSVFLGKQLNKSTV